MTLVVVALLGLAAVAGAPPAFYFGLALGAAAMGLAMLLGQWSQP